MNALISPNEIVVIQYVSGWVQTEDDWEPEYSEINGAQRVAEVSQEPFDVASPLFWVDCPDDCSAEFWYYKDGALHQKPEDAEKPEEN